MINLYHNLLSDTPFDAAAIERASVVKIDKKISLRMCTAEDLIVYKMILRMSSGRFNIRAISLMTRKSFIGWNSMKNG